MGRLLSLKNLLGCLMVVAMVFGGHAAFGETNDTMLMLATVAISTLVLLARPRGSSLENRIVVLFCAVIFLVGVQLVPIPWINVLATQNAIPELLANELSSARPWQSISLNPGRTLDVFSWLLVFGLFFISLSRLATEDLFGLVPFFLIGVACNVMVGTIQFITYSPQERLISNITTYQAGFFTNANHFATLMAASIPIVLFMLSSRRRYLLMLLYIAVAFTMIFLSGSRAGMMLGVTATVATLLLVLQLGAVSRWTFAVGSLVAVVISYTLISRLLVQGLRDDVRSTIATTTWEGIWDNLPWGVGFGAFQDAYRVYEKMSDIQGVFINHAHNDYLELIFEGGIPAVLVLFLCLVTLAIQTWRVRGFQARLISSLAVWIILLHSIVDYPLRTFSMSIVFLYLIAIVFSVRARSNLHSSEPEQMLQSTLPSRAFINRNAPRSIAS